MLKSSGLVFLPRQIGSTRRVPSSTGKASEHNSISILELLDGREQIVNVLSGSAQEDCCVYPFDRWVTLVVFTLPHHN
jgi:hypothetical protein